MRASIESRARRARAGRRAGDLGALEPRRHAPRHALRPSRHVVRLRGEARRARRPTSSSARAAPEPRRCSRWRCPGSMYIYQGEELGLPEVEDIPVRAPPGPDVAPLRRRRPRAATAAASRFPGRARSRRTASAATARARPWLDQPDDWAPLTVEAQADDPASMLTPLPRRPARCAATAPWGARRGLRWLPHADDVLAFARGERLHLPRQLRPAAG